MSEWISVKDHLPHIDYAHKRSHVTVLAAAGGSVFLAHFRELRTGDGASTYLFNTFCKTCKDGDVLLGITHWMAIPAPPV